MKKRATTPRQRRYQIVEVGERVITDELGRYRAVRIAGPGAGRGFWDTYDLETHTLSNLPNPPAYLLEEARRALAEEVAR